MNRGTTGRSLKGLPLQTSQPDSAFSCTAPHNFLLSTIACYHRKNVVPLPASTELGRDKRLLLEPRSAIALFPPSTTRFLRVFEPPSVPILIIQAAKGFAVPHQNYPWVNGIEQRTGIVVIELHGPDSSSRVPETNPSMPDLPSSSHRARRIPLTCCYLGPRIVSGNLQPHNNASPTYKPYS
ncbi:uncharacterized protein LOC134221077 [Armigeres subalbatus]|uniref:uncharacterized protein LOC134221077 n=1 Tax=Armigeres subalbatus TaxID=124917 RepID=UPI002ED2A968